MPAEGSTALELGPAMDEEDPNGFVVLRRKALAAQADLQALAEVFHMAVRGAKEPHALGVDDVRLLCEAFLRHVKPVISAGRAGS